MNYPLWDVPLLGGGLIIALISIPHVFVSHFAVGGGIFLAWTERKGLVENKPYLVDFVKKYTLFFVLLTLVFGAVSGVGIWFSIGLVHPPATSTLIHKFVFGWAMEWVFFLIEISAILVYYYSWDRVDPKTHNIIGWVYAGSAWMSLVIINGILTFMLTPGPNPGTSGFWAALINPTYFPSMLIRTCASLALAWLYMLVMASREKEGAQRDDLIRYISKWLIPAFIGLPLFGAWFVAMVPELAREMMSGGAAAVTLFAALSVAISGVIFLYAYFGGYRNPRNLNTQVAILLMVLGFAVTGATEWVREAVRKPYVIQNYMYSNAILKDDVPRINVMGILNLAKWTEFGKTAITPENQLAVGRDIFTLECANCHTVQGYNGINLLVKGWDQEYLSNQIRYLDKLKGFMPPFAGKEEEREALAAWLASLTPAAKMTGGVR